MKIESILKRPNGTVVTLGETDYHFKPEAGGAHVAHVEDNAHIQTFLGIPEGYRIADDDGPAPEPKSVIKDVPGEDLDALDKEALAVLFEAQLGVRPPSTLSKAKIIEALRAAPAA